MGNDDSKEELKDLSADIYEHLQKRFHISHHPVYTSSSHFKLLTEKLTNRQAVLRIMAINDEVESNKLEAIILKKLANTNSNRSMTTLEMYHFQNDHNYCSSRSKCFLLFSLTHTIPLREFAVKKKIKGELISEKTMLRALHSLLSGVLWLRHVDQPHGNINTSNIYYSEDTDTMILSDPWISPSGLQSFEEYPSPDKLRKMRNQTDEYDPYGSDTFAVGMCILECLTLQNPNEKHLNSLYKKNGSFDFPLLEEYIKNLPYSELKSQLKAILLSTPEDRLRYLNSAVNKKILKTTNAGIRSTIQNRRPKKTDNVSPSVSHFPTDAFSKDKLHAQPPKTITGPVQMQQAPILKVEPQRIDSGVRSNRLMTSNVNIVFVSHENARPAVIGYSPFSQRPISEHKAVNHGVRFGQTNASSFNSSLNLTQDLQRIDYRPNNSINMVSKGTPIMKMQSPSALNVIPVYNQIPVIGKTHLPNGVSWKGVPTGVPQMNGVSDGRKAGAENPQFVSPSMNLAPYLNFKTDYELSKHSANSAYNGSEMTFKSPFPESSNYFLNSNPLKLSAPLKSNEPSALQGISSMESVESKMYLHSRKDFNQIKQVQSQDASRVSESEVLSNLTFKYYEPLPPKSSNFLSQMLRPSRGNQTNSEQQTQPQQSRANPEAKLIHDKEVNFGLTSEQLPRFPLPNLQKNKEKLQQKQQQSQVREQMKSLEQKGSNLRNEQRAINKEQKPQFEPLCEISVVQPMRFSQFEDSDKLSDYRASYVVMKNSPPEVKGEIKFEREISKGGPSYSSTFSKVVIEAQGERREQQDLLPALKPHQQETYRQSQYPTKLQIDSLELQRREDKFQDVHKVTTSIENEKSHEADTFGTPVRPPTSNTDPQNNPTIPEEKSSDQDSVKGEASLKDKGKFIQEIYENGGKYIGFVRNGKRNGEGTYYYTDGGYYEGQWRDNMMNGFGRIYYDTGDLAYEGGWYRDEFHGQGKVFNDTFLTLQKPFNYHNFEEMEKYWITYEGDLSHDIKSGFGKLTFSNGEYYSGKFRNDQVHGKGTFHKLDGTIIRGDWLQGILINSEAPK